VFSTQTITADELPPAPISNCSIAADVFVVIVSGTTHSVPLNRAALMLFVAPEPKIHATNIEPSVATSIGIHDRTLALVTAPTTSSAPICWVPRSTRRTVTSGPVPHLITASPLRFEATSVVRQLTSSSSVPLSVQMRVSESKVAARSRYSHVSVTVRPDSPKP